MKRFRMFAYCDQNNGDILFAPQKPRTRLIIAQHNSLAVLEMALRECGAHDHYEYINGEQIGEARLAVPWYAVAKTPEDEVICVKRFAAKVAAWFGDALPAQ
jgi:hypothetical protein